MKNGFRQPAQAPKKEAMQKLQTEVANLQMAGRISQMMVKQLMDSVKNQSSDLNAALNQMYELQYTLNALTKHLNVDSKTLGAIANVQRLADFNEAAQKADGKEELELADVVGEQSTIVITSSAVDDNGADAGIFRSRLKLADSGVPDLIQALIGKSVGDKVDVKLNNINHSVELLAVRNPIPKLVEQSPAAEVVQ